MSGFCCVSCVPASCVHIWFVSCPCFMSLWVKYVPAVFVSLCVNYPVYISPVFWVWFLLVYSLLPRCILSMSVMPCPALMSPLNIIICVYVLVCVFLFLPRVCTVTETRPNRKRRPFTSFVLFIFWKVFYLFLCLSVPRQGSRRSSSRS